MREIKGIIKNSEPQHQDPAQSKQQQQVQLELIILGQSFLCVILVQLLWLLWCYHSAAHHSRHHSREYRNAVAARRGK